MTEKKLYDLVKFEIKKSKKMTGGYDGEKKRGSLDYRRQIRCIYYDNIADIVKAFKRFYVKFGKIGSHVDFLLDLMYIVDTTNDKAQTNADDIKKYYEAKSRGMNKIIKLSDADDVSRKENKEC